MLDGWRALLPPALALLVVLAGCNGPQSVSSSPTEKATVDIDSNSMPAGTETHRSTSSPTSDARSVPEGIENVNLSDQQREQVHTTMADFYEKLPDEQSERRETVIDVAERICGNYTDFEESVDVAAVADGDIQRARHNIRRADFAVQMINEHFTDNIDRSALTKLRSGSADAARYAPLYASYNQMAEDACRVERTQNDQAIEDFQTSALYFGVEMALIQSGVFYKPAFGTTRAISNNLALSRIRFLCGDRCYALALSEIHWGLRGTPLGLLNYYKENTEGINPSSDQFETTLRFVINQQGEEYRESIVADCAGSIADEASEAVDNPREKSEELVDSATGLIGDSSDTETKTEGGLDAALLSLRNCGTEAPRSYEGPTDIQGTSR